jgi:Trypsin-co-occurring domain 2
LIGGLAVPESTSAGGIGLAEFIRGLREEITAATYEGGEAKVRFRPGPIDLELQVRAEQKGGINGKVEFKVFGTGASLGGEGSATSSWYHTLKMRLEIASDDNLISGEVKKRPR